MHINELKSMMDKKNRLSVSVSPHALNPVEEILAQEGWGVVGQAFTSSTGTRFAAIQKDGDKSLSVACGEPEAPLERTDSFLWKTAGGGHGYPNTDWNG